jgi:hypothetical protein
MGQHFLIFKMSLFLNSSKITGYPDGILWFSSVPSDKCSKPRPVWDTS